MNDFVVYILKSKIKEVTYVGFTNNLERRFIGHNCGKTKFTRNYKPWEIVYKELFTREDKAVKREIYFKSAAERRLIRKILGRT